VFAERARAFLTDQRGASAVEFSIVGPMFLLLLIGIILAGWYMNVLSSLRLALEESGRALEIDDDLTQTQLAAIVTDKLSAIGDTNVTVTLADDTTVTGVTMKRVTATYTLNINFPFLPAQAVSIQQGVTVPMPVS
jgi:Flp pilus assembly protein TadG